MVASVVSKLSRLRSLSVILLDSVQLEEVLTAGSLALRGHLPVIEHPRSWPYTQHEKHGDGKAMPIGADLRARLLDAVCKRQCPHPELA